MKLFLQNVFSTLIVKFFSEKLLNFELWKKKKLENMLKKEYFGKKRFDPFERQLYQNGKAENMQLVTDHLVLLSTRKFDVRKNLFVNYDWSSLSSQLRRDSRIERIEDSITVTWSLWSSNFIEIGLVLKGLLVISFLVNCS